MRVCFLPVKNFDRRTNLEFSPHIRAQWQERKAVWMKKWAGLLLAFLLLLGATASAAVQLGDRAEDFSIVNSDGTVSTLSLMLAQKKAVYVYFWASWCDMSREELLVVQTMYDQYGEDCGFIVASVEAEDTVSTVEALKRRRSA